MVVQLQHTFTQHRQSMQLHTAGAVDMHRGRSATCSTSCTMLHGCCTQFRTAATCHGQWARHLWAAMCAALAQLLSCSWSGPLTGGNEGGGGPAP
jgi:hypothetical protein